VQDRSSRTIALLRQEILQLQQELAEYKQGKRMVGEDGLEAVNDMFHENRLLQTENQTMRTRLKALQETLNSLTVRNAELQAQKASQAWSKAGSDTDVTQMVQHYLLEIEEMRARLCESESINAQLRRAAAVQSGKSPGKGMSPPKFGNSSVNVLIEEAKRNLEKVASRREALRLTPHETLSLIKLFLCFVFRTNLCCRRINFVAKSVAVTIRP